MPTITVDAPTSRTIPIGNVPRRLAGTGTLWVHVCCTERNRGEARHEIGFSEACLNVEAVWKLRVGAEAYYEQQVARGLEEYYTGAGEAPGYWTGGGVATLGLTGEVDPTDLRTVLAGLAPGTGLSPNGTTLRPHPRWVPGFDITFSAPTPSLRSSLNATAAST